MQRIFRAEGFTFMLKTGQYYGKSGPLVSRLPNDEVKPLERLYLGQLALDMQ